MLFYSYTTIFYKQCPWNNLIQKHYPFCILFYRPRKNWASQLEIVIPSQKRSTMGVLEETVRGDPRRDPPCIPPLWCLFPPGRGNPEGINHPLIWRLMTKMIMTGIQLKLILIHINLSWSIIFHFDRFGSISIHFDPFLSTLIHTFSILIWFDSYWSIWSMLIHYEPCWSMLIHFDPFLASTQRLKPAQHCR